MKPPSQRLLYLDWVRGIAALVMLQGHVFNSFTRTDLREGGPYVMSQFVGGMPPAVFLFLLGVTFAFLMDSQARKGISAAGRWLVSMKRSGYLFAAAFAFRLQLWLFAGGQSPWTDLFRVDILNCMGLALLVLAIMTVFRTEERIRLCAVLGVAIAAASPLISALNWSGTPEIIRNYIIPDHNFFGFFPWASFVAFGMSAGSVLRVIKTDEVPNVMQWVGWGGVTLAFGGWAISNLPMSVYSNSDFWLNSPALIFIKVGAILILLAFAWLWNMRTTAEQWSWVRQFGVTSLLVYWVHVELVYGRWFGFLKEQLSVGQTVFASVVCILLMLALSVLRSNWPLVRGYFNAGGTLPRRVSGD
jgi:uncharacterized membrane protein